MGKTRYHIEDYLGKKINRLEPISISEIRAKDRSIQWDFRCECGTIITLPPYRVIQGKTRSCGCYRKELYNGISREEHFSKYIGLRKGSLVVEGFVISSPSKLKCRCDCGKIRMVSAYEFNKNKILSCGCKNRMGNYKHGYSSNKRLYNIYQEMMVRCYDKNFIHYDRYGGRGITVCDEWKEHREKFFDWAIYNGYAPDLTIDRIDNGKGYSPENCRWVTMYEQCRNKSSNVFFTYNGETLCLTDLAHKYNINVTTLWHRLNKMHWDIEKAITEPIRNQRKSK